MSTEQYEPDAAQCMAEALRLAELGRYSSFPNPRVGCVILARGAVVGRGWHERAGEAHAEVHALREAGDFARGAEMFVTLEPCSHQGRTPPCADAIIAAGIKKISVAMQDPNPQVAGAGIARLQAAGIEVEVGLMEMAVRELNRGFVSRMQRGRPFVTLKLGASLDGRTATAAGESKWITSAEARADVQRLRAEAGAVMSSANTVLADDPQLNLRDFAQSARQPDRIVLDSKARVPQRARVWQADGAKRWWMVGDQLLEVGADQSSPTSASAPRPPLGKILQLLAEKQINSVLVECGPTLAGALLKENLVDELICYLAPSILGSDARGLAVLPGVNALADRLQFEFKDVRKVGPDLRITALPHCRVH